MKEKDCRKRVNNIAVFCGSLYRSGAEHVTVYLAEGLKHLGYNTVIITCYKRQQEYSVPEGIKRYILDYTGSKKNIAQMIIYLRKILKNDKIDVLCVLTTPLSVYAIPASVGLGVKVIISERNDPTHFAGRLITKYLSTWCMKKADGFVFQTQDAKAYYNTQLKGRGRVIYNPLFSDNLPCPYEGKPEKTIVAVGRLNPQKNHIMLIRAFAECPEINQEYKLVIYGEGELRLKLEKIISDLGIAESVLLPGNVPDVCEKIRKTSLYVLPSNFEGMPNALIEAMALGLPCISTDCPIGGPSELIENGVNGVLIPTDDKLRLIEKMKEILFTPMLSDRLRKNAVLIRKTLDKDQILAQWAKYIEEIAYESKS